MPMIPEKMKEVLAHEGVVAVASLGKEGMHLANTWNSYIRITADGRLIYPAGGMRTTEANLEHDNRVLLTFGSRDVEGLHGQGAGFLITGTAAFIKTGHEFDDIRQRFPWARAAVEIRIESVHQTL